MGTTYDIGDVVRVWGRFSTAEGSTDYKDPTVVNLAYDTPTSTAPTTDTITPPSTIGSASIIHHETASTGEFYADITATGKGLYEYRWTSTGLLQTSEESWFSIRPRRVT
jgi:hypothetical protein